MFGAGIVLPRKKGFAARKYAQALSCSCRRRHVLLQHAGCPPGLLIRLVGLQQWGMLNTLAEESRSVVLRACLPCAQTNARACTRRSWRCPAAAHARVQAWSPAMCCAPLASRRTWRTPASGRQPCRACQASGLLSGTQCGGQLLGRLSAACGRGRKLAPCCCGCRGTGQASSQAKTCASAE